MSCSCPIHIQSVYNHDIPKCPKYLTINALLISITLFLDFWTPQLYTFPRFLLEVHHIWSFLSDILNATISIVHHLILSLFPDQFLFTIGFKHWKPSWNSTLYFHHMGRPLHHPQALFHQFPHSKVQRMQSGKKNIITFWTDRMPKREWKRRWKSILKKLYKKRRARSYIKISRAPKLLLIVDEHCKDTNNL